VLLRPRSLVIFDGDAYERYHHEIATVAADEISDAVANCARAGVRVGDTVPRTGTRVSFTVRYVPSISDVDAAAARG
jgi:hypothetical protein